VCSTARRGKTCGLWLKRESGRTDPLKVSGFFEEETREPTGGEDSSKEKIGTLQGRKGVPRLEAAEREKKILSYTAKGRDRFERMEKAFATGFLGSTKGNREKGPVLIPP